MIEPVFVDTVPPPLKRGRRPGSSIADKLIANPGQWALVSDKLYRHSHPVGVRGEFFEREARSELISGVMHYRHYARFIGPVTSK
jgi:hypothetical protein